MCTLFLSEIKSALGIFFFPFVRTKEAPFLSGNTKAPRSRRAEGGGRVRERTRGRERESARVLGAEGRGPSCT